MTYETNIIAREGYMKPQRKLANNKYEDGEMVTTRAVAVAIELETGISADGEDEDPAKAINKAEDNLARKIEEKRKAREAKNG